MALDRVEKATSLKEITIDMIDAAIGEGTFDEVLFENAEAVSLLTSVTEETPGETKFSPQQNYNAQMVLGLIALQNHLKSNTAFNLKTTPFFKAKKIAEEDKLIQSRQGDLLFFEALSDLKDQSEQTLEEFLNKEGRENYSYLNFILKLGRAVKEGSTLAAYILYYYSQHGSLEEKIIACSTINDNPLSLKIPKLTEYCNGYISEHKEFIQGLKELEICPVNEKKAIVNFASTVKKANEFKEIEHAAHALLYIAECQYRLAYKAKINSLDPKERINKAIQVHIDLIERYKNLSRKTHMRIFISHFKLLNVAPDKSDIISIVLSTLQAEINLLNPDEKIINDVLKNLISSGALTDAKVWQMVVDRLILWHNKIDKESIRLLLVAQLQKLKTIITKKEENHHYANSLGDLITLLRTKTKDVELAEQLRLEAIDAYKQSADACKEAKTIGSIDYSLKAATLTELDGEGTDGAIDIYKKTMQYAIAIDDAKQVIAIVDAVKKFQNSNDLVTSQINILKEIFITAFAKLNDILFIRKYPQEAKVLYEKLFELALIDSEFKKFRETCKTYFDYIVSQKKFVAYRNTGYFFKLLESAEENFIPALFTLLRLNSAVKNRIDRPMYLKAKLLLLKNDAKAIPELEKIHGSLIESARQDLELFKPNTKEYQNIRMARFYLDLIEECKRKTLPLNPDAFILKRATALFGKQDKAILYRIEESMRKAYKKSRKWLLSKINEEPGMLLIYSHGDMSTQLSVATPLVVYPSLSSEICPSAPSPVKEASAEQNIAVVVGLSPGAPAVPASPVVLREPPVPATIPTPIAIPQREILAIATSSPAISRSNLEIGIFKPAEEPKTATRRLHKIDSDVPPIARTAPSSTTKRLISLA